MQKTKLGISVGMLGAAIYFASLFSGYMIAVLMVGYVLLFEENGWLKRNAVKAIVLMMLFSFFTTTINLIPNVIGVMGNLMFAFGKVFNMDALKYMISAITGVIDIIEKVLFLALGVKALNQGTIVISAVDKVLNKYM